MTLPLSKSKEPQATIHYAEGLGDLSQFSQEIIAAIFMQLGSISDWNNCTLLSRDLREIALIPNVFVTLCQKFGLLQKGFIYAIKEGNAPLLAKFLDAGVSFTTPDGLSPLDFIATNEKKILELLVRSKLQVFSTDECFKALQLAVKYDSKEIVGILMSQICLGAVVCGE